MPDFPDDTTIQSIFEHAKKGRVGGAPEFPVYAAVYATYVEHRPMTHPKDSQKPSDAVWYANGRLMLSPDKTMLFGEFKFWRNIYQAPYPSIGPNPGHDEDEFADHGKNITILISVTDKGKAHHQMMVAGKPFHGDPNAAMNSTYENGLFVEKFKDGVRSLSFTLDVSYEK
jgi:hypothetical protein